MNAVLPRHVGATALMVSVSLTGWALAGDLTEAVKRADTAAVVSALKASPASVHEADNDGRTPLHWAAEAGNVRVARALLDAGASVGVRDGHGHTPLHLAARSGRAAVVALLISRGADVRALAYNKYTPLHLAAWSGEARTIKRLLAAGANVHAADYSGRAPLNYASTRQAVDLLVRAGAEPNAAQMPPLLDAAFHGFAPAVAALLDRGADLHVTDYNHYTPLHLAAWNGSAATVRILIRRGADVHYRDDWGWTPLAWAEYWKHQEVSALLKTAMARTPFKADARHW